MAELDLIPSDYRRLRALRKALVRLAGAYLIALLLVGIAKAGLAYGVRHRSQELEQLQAALERERSQQSRLEELRREQDAARKRLMILSGLRGGIAAVDMFNVVDRAVDANVWFLDWKFRRAGELVENDPERVHTGYFIVLPLEKRDEREKAWLMETHMEIHAQARDHSSLAAFVRRLVEQPEIDEARVLATSTRRQGQAEVVDFEIAVVVEDAGVIEEHFERAMRELGPRAWAGVLGATFVLTLLAAWLYLLKPSVSHYRELAGTASPFAIADAETRAAANESAIAESERKVEAMREQLYGSSSALPLEQIESYVIDRLDRLSVPRGVQLVSVTPGEPGAVLMFDELPYDVDVRGDYFALHDWLRAVEDDLRPMVVKHFEMRTGARDESVAMTLRLVSYRPRGEGS